MAEMVVFVDANFGGLHTHLYETTADFTQLSLGGVGVGIGGGNWNDKTSSIVVVSGHWQCFRDVNFHVPQGGVLGPASIRLSKRSALTTTRFRRSGWSAHNAKPDGRCHPAQ
jgi:hypothetical protein